MRKEDTGTFDTDLILKTVKRLKMSLKGNTTQKKKKKKIQKPNCLADRSQKLSEKYLMCI